jgi:rhamnosyl/mannosyltransferase
VTKIRQSDADLVHVHLPNPAAVLAYLASNHPGRVLFTYHSDTVRQRALGALFEPLLHKALRRSSAIIATSPDYVRTSPILAAHADRCHVIPYGIEVERFERRDAVAVNSLRQKYGERLVVSVGRLVYYKGFEHLIRAMIHVSGRLVIVGDGPLRRDLESLALQIGVASKVVFTGEIQNENVVPYYHAADVFVLPSVARSEAFGIVQIEAMAAGRPVINTALDSGVPFVSLHEKTGITVPPADPAALATAISRLLDDPELCARFGQAARQRAREEFSLKIMAARTLELYQRIMTPLGAC